MMNNNWTCPRCNQDKCTFRCGGCGTQKGDWKCPSCHDIVFASKTECRKCNNNAEPSMKKGDWICGECHDHNFASRSTCRRCNHAKAATKESRHTMEVRKGDWTCSQCGDHNFATRNVCRKCQHPKNESSNHSESKSATNDHAKAESNNSTKSDECPVCYERPKDSFLPCGHVICKVCVYAMTLCPFCRKSYHPNEIKPVFW
jgi:hypothetical protein